MKLIPITKEEYLEYEKNSIQKYVKELMKAGQVTEEQAKEQAQATFKRIVPNGIDTENHYFYYAYENNQKVGFIWYAFREEESAFIYDFFVLEKMQRKGYGRKIMLACEELVRKANKKYMRLHVFGHNTAARALYDSIGYQPISIQMRKEL
ncbi:GNAT family N-acetyltransferase [Candidatus Izemoplasma sp. B36]|uniref:GNAT family N-acetyltransferase n=1 Tax=Candidatus Izemoplasma sp. B36 TaxID=3242468 RepID=UPI0035565E06